MDGAEKELWSLLARRAALEDAGARAAIEAEIQARFSRRKAVIFTDMSGFSRMTRDHGIVHFLGLIHRMRELCLPRVEAHGGQLVKTIGDDLVLAFDDPKAAVKAAIDMREACVDDAARRPEGEQIRLAMGVGFGDVLDLDGRDLFGDEVNRASKLGEDIAEAGEILVTSATAEAIGELKGWWFEVRKARISGIAFDYHALARGG